MSTDILINRYKVLQRLGEGAMGAVWLVEDSTNGQQLAMKVLSQQVSTNEKSFLQLKQEFRLMTQLHHPNCCAVYDYGQLPEGSPYLTMELVPGVGLDEMLPVKPADFRGILAQLLLALGYTHQLGYVHSDVKPENIRVRPDGVLKLMDYGLMERTGRSGAPIKGTLAYLAPEVVKRGPIDQRADLYAVGALAYELLSGRPPFVSKNPMDVLRAHVTDAPEPLARVGVSVDAVTERIVMKLLAKEPMDRYQSAYEVLEDLGVEVPAGIGGTLLTSPMMGRDAPLSTLSESLVSLAKWQPGGALLLTGPAGIGKSRLLEEFRYLVQVEDLAYASGTLNEQAATPYAPVVEVLRKLLPAMRERMNETLTLHAPVLVRLLPELGVEPAIELDPPSRDKLRLQSVVSEVLVQLSLRQGLVVVFEDWHWVDALTADLFEYLLRNTREASLLLVLTARSMPESAAGWGDRVSHLVLDGLDPRSLWRMVTSMLGSEEVGAGFMKQVSEFSEGNPFFVERLLEHLVREGTLASSRGRWNTHVELTDAQLPTDLAAMLLRKIEALSSDGQTLARAVAVTGRGTTIDLLQQLAVLPDEGLLDALQELEQHHVLVQNAEGAYRFTQDQMQALLYSQLPLEEQARLHTATVAAQEHRIWGLKPDEMTFEDVRSLAYHSLRGTIPEKTIVYALEAGVRSARLFALADAEYFLAAGLAQVRAQPGPRWKKHLLEYLRHLGDVRRTASQAQPAKDVLEEAVALAEELGKQQLLGRMLTSLAKVCQMLQDQPAALLHCARSAEICEANGDMNGLSRCLQTSGRLNFFKGNQAEALDHVERAMVAAEAGGDPTVRGTGLALAGYFYVSSNPDRIDQGIRYLEQSLALLKEGGDKVGLINSYNLMGNAQATLGEYMEAWHSFGHTRRLSYEAGSKDDEVVALINLATTAFELGNIPDAVARAKEARSLAEQRDIKYARGLAIVVEALASLFAGDVGQARGTAQEALDFVRAIKNKYIEALVLQYQVEVLLNLGRLDEARASGEALKALIAETGNKEPESRLNTLLAEILGRQGDLAGATALAAQAAEAATAAHTNGIRVRALRVQAWLAMLSKDWETSEAIARQAIAISEAIGCKYQTAELSGLLAELALATGGALSDADSQFRAMEVLGRQIDSPLVQGLACFGLAAVRPYKRQAQGLTADASRLLEQFMGGVDEESRGYFLSLSERRRAFNGDPVALHLPRRLADKAIAIARRLQSTYSRHA